MNTLFEEQLNKVKNSLGSAQRIFVLTGAGVSAESNVPTFRGGGGASVWRGMPFEQLSSAQMVEENLPLVWEWFDYRRNIIGECEPNAAHRAIFDWQRAGDFDEFTLVTQNIDGLHRRAGSSKILELHGNIWRARCQMCDETFDVRDLPIDERPPICVLCGDFLRPNVVLFGETLPAKIYETAAERAKTCDVCLVVGTSSLVYPATSLPETARKAGAKIIEINPEPTSLTENSDISLRGKAGEILPLLSQSVIANLNDSEKFVSQSEAAKLRGVSRQRIGQLVKSGRLNTVGEGHDALISVEDLMSLTEAKKGRPRKSEENTIDRKTGETGKSTIAERMSAEGGIGNVRFPKGFDKSKVPPMGGGMTSETHPLRVDFVNSEDFPFLNNLGMTFAPGKKQTGAISGDWNRDLPTDIARLREHYKVNTLISLIEDDELDELGIIDLEKECRAQDIEIIRFPIADFSLPASPDNYVSLISKIVKQINQNKIVVVHCKGGLGRAGMTAACAIVAATDGKLSGADAVKNVRSARKGTVETKAQEDFVRSFDELWKNFIADETEFTDEEFDKNKTINISIGSEWMDEPEELNLDPERLKKFQGCLLGGAVGDALGAAIEFDSIARIRQKFGAEGLTDYASAYGRVGAITDDTQMTLFTAEGLLRGKTRQMHRGLSSAIHAIYFAYIRWLETQGVKLDETEFKYSVCDVQSWLRDLPELNSRRAPGNSCLSALQSGNMGTIETPINNSKGCGGVMRVAPVGLVGLKPFELAMDSAAITHGHSTGYLSAGVLALIISRIINGKSLTDAINHAVYEILPQHANYEETFEACDKALKLAQSKNIPPSPEAVETLGGGWIAEEALAIAVYCSLVYENDFEKALLLAVNHSGDSDSTGAITGNILGSLHGIDTIPEKWLTRLELKNDIAEIAEDLLIGFRSGNDWWNKYPGV